MVTATLVTGAIIFSAGAATPVLAATAASTAAGTAATTAAGTAAATTAGATAQTVAVVLGAAETGALAGASVGAGAAVGTGVGSAGLTTAGIAAGPIGWLALGASLPEDVDEHTFDCWKPVLRDESMEASKGMLFKDVVNDTRIRYVEVNDESYLPKITLHNIWNEKFAIEYVVLTSGQVALHANRLN